MGNLYQCQFCNQLTKDEEHEQNCLFNPQRKSCFTCHNQQGNTYSYNGNYKNKYICSPKDKTPMVLNDKYVTNCDDYENEPLKTFTYNQYSEENIIQYPSLDIKG